MSDPVPRRIPPGHSDTAATALWAVGTAVPAIAAGFHFYRGAPIDGVVFSAVALVCLAGRRTDAAPARVRAAHPPVRLTAPWTIAVVLGVGAVLAVARRYSPVDALLFVALAVPVLFLTATRGGPPPCGEPDPDRQAPAVPGPDRPLRRAMVWWACPVLALSACELVNYFLSTSGPAAEQDHPPLSDVVTSLFDSDYRRLVLALVWLWLGVGLLEALGVLRVVRTGGVAPGDGAAGRPGAAR